jgi:hypothetical protein
MVSNSENLWIKGPSLYEEADGEFAGQIQLRRYDRSSKVEQVDTPEMAETTCMDPEVRSFRIASQQRLRTTSHRPKSGRQ